MMAQSSIYKFALAPFMLKMKNSTSLTHPGASARAELVDWVGAVLGVDSGAHGDRGVMTHIRCVLGITH